MQVTDEMVRVALAKFNETITDPIMELCHRCSGNGYHHGFGPDGASPDWCEECGGNQYNIRPGEEDRAMGAALSAALAAMWQPIETAPKKEMFIWAHRDRERWKLGLAYQNVSGGWSCAYGTEAPRLATHWMPLPPAPSQLSKRDDAERDSRQEA